MNYFRSRCWFSCKASLSTGGRWVSSSLRFSCRSLHLAFQSTAKSTYIHEIYVHPTNKKSEQSWFL